MTRLFFINTPEGRRYRFWQTVADEWCGEPMERAEAVAELAGMNPTKDAAWADEAVTRIETDDSPHRDWGHIEGDAWWLGASASDCESGWHDPALDDRTKCGYCGAAL